jgi:hypothetical protein
MEEGIDIVNCKQVYLTLKISYEYQVKPTEALFIKCAKDLTTDCAKTRENTQNIRIGDGNFRLCDSQNLHFGFCTV